MMISNMKNPALVIASVILNVRMLAWLANEQVQGQSGLGGV
jgi:hypothetical protein